MIKTRIAPSPTGYLHIGTLRMVLWDYLIAKKSGGIFMLRLEDTDQGRTVADSYAGIVKILNRLGLVPDEGPAPFPDLGKGPYIQSERLHIYREYADRMVANGTAYPCFCTAERLDSVRAEQEAAGLPTRYDGCCRHLDPAEAAARVAAGEPHTIRLKVPKGEKVVFPDVIRGNIEFPTSDVDDQVLLKTDGFPTYHLAVVVDDFLMNVTLVLRGEEWIPSSPKQALIAKALGIALPQYAHAPVILGADRKKLSKRTGDTAVEQYLAKGYLVEALINYIAFLGWNPKTTEEIFSLAELVERFDLSDVQKAGAVFDVEKLDWMNAKYIVASDADKLYAALADYLREYQAEFFENVFLRHDESYNRAILAELRTRIKRFEEFPALTTFFYAEPAMPSDEVLLNEKMKVASHADARSALGLVLDLLPAISDADWNKEHLNSLIIAAIAENGLKNGQVLWPVRAVLSGEQFSPGAFELLATLGRERAMARLSKGFAFLSEKE